MRVAVTGAGGLIGLQVCARALARGHAALGLARSAEGLARVRATGAQAAGIAGLEPDALAEAFRGADAVVHLAQVGRESGAATYEAVNVEGTRAVVAAARRSGVGRLVYFSGLGVAHYGMRPHCTNAYFLSKLACEALVLEAGLEAAVFRPSYVLGPGGDFLPALLREMQSGELLRVGDGDYRLQPVALGDAAALVLAALERPAGARPFVFELVGPEAVTYDAFLRRLAAVAGAAGRALAYRVREVPVAEALRQARAGGYRGLQADELDCLLCDELGDPRPLQALLGRELTALDAALAAALPGLLESPRQAQ